MKHIIGLDIETTGLGTEDRIIELCAVATDLAGKEIPEKSFYSRFNPCRQIDPKAEAVHHISLASLMKEPLWESKAAEVQKVLQDASLIIIHNAAFDAPFISRELKKAGVPPVTVPTLCTMRSSRWATFDGKVPRLAELCYALGVSYDSKKAHAASYDVAVMLSCFRLMLRYKILNKSYIYPFDRISEEVYLDIDGLSIDRP